MQRWHFAVVWSKSFYIFTLLRASAMLKHVIDIGWTSVCLSVTRWYCIKTAEYIVMLSSPHDSPFILVLCISRSSRNSDGVTANRGGVWKYRDFRPITCYISKTVEGRWVYAARRLTSIEFSFDPCNVYRDSPGGVGYQADARSVGDSHPSCFTMSPLHNGGMVWYSRV